MGLEDLSLADRQRLQSALGSSSPELKRAFDAYDNIDKQAAGVVVDVATGKTPSFAAIGSIVAAGLAATGVGAPVAAVVAAAIPIISAVASALGMFGGDEHCAWKVGGVCFNGKRPYGPADPQWTTLDAFAAIKPVKGGFGGTTIEPPLKSAFPFYDQIMADYSRASPVALVGGLASGGTSVTPAPSPKDVFLRAYGEAWRSNAERAINGHNSLSEADLFKQVVNAWETARPTHGSLDFTIDGSGDSFVDKIVRGDVDGQNRPPLTLSGGPIFDPRLPGSASVRRGSALDALFADPKKASRGGALDVLEINQKPQVGSGATTGSIGGVGIGEIAALGAGVGAAFLLLRFLRRR